MAIVTDLTVDIIIDNVKVDEYELSDTLDNYDITEILASAYCGCYNVARRNNFLKTTDYGWVGAFDKDSGVCQYPFKITPSGGTYIWDTGATGYNTPDGIYSGVIWLKHELSTECEMVITQNNAADYRMVTKWNVNKFVFTLPALSSRFTEVAQTTWVQAAYPCCYVPEYWGTMTYHTARGLPYDQTVDVSICPYHVYIFDDQIFLHAIKVESDFIYNSTQEVYTKVFGESRYLSFDGTTSIATSYNNDYLSVARSNTSYNTNFELSGYPDNNRFPVSWQGPGGYNRWYQIGGEDQQNYLTLWDHSGYSSTGGYIRINNHFSKVDDVLHYFANMGVYFYADKLYKPVIEDKIVTGYTDDMETSSDIDNWDGSSIHDVPVTPPVPPVPPGDDEDNDDPVSTAGAPFGTGLAHYYVTTVDSAVLGQISEALGSWNIDSTKKDLYRNLISCKILKPPAGIPSTPSVFTIYGVKPQYNGADITIPAVNGNPDITFGPYTISRKFNDFRDYAPYTRAEIFLPYCGWCALPSHVVGRSVSVSYFTDVIAGTVKAVVFCEANPVAEAAGVMAYDIPFAAQNVGAKIQAANTGMLAYGKAALQLSAGIGQAVATKGKQGLSSIVNGAFGVAAGYNQLSMAANENYTEISGKAGDGCALAGIDTIIIKIVRPKYGPNKTAPFVPDGFAHTVGFLSMKEAKVSAASGLILCDNVDTSGIGKATDAERAEIKRVLETGLYVNNPPE